MTITDTEPVGYHAYSVLHSPNGPVVAASPGDGWLIEVTRRETCESWTERVVTWLVHQNGSIVPAVVDELETGGTWFPTQDAEFSVRLFHPAHPVQQDVEERGEGESQDA
ncbi:hypothetical protein [Streptomyces africanus]|uniref:hypothetical protein n=1 Tax=Streptomyces africanus TaxID=231024 RepID=UPI000A3981D4|nr:hypothetical protein [Streptomyces africanus]